MSERDVDQAKQILDDLIKKAQKLGADAADALMVDGHSLSVSWRGGKIESLEHSEGGDLGLRVLVGKRQAIVSTTDHRPKMLQEMVERAVSMAKVAPEDPYCGLADPADIARTFPALELADSYSIDPQIAIERAKEAEDAALAVEGVAQCDSTNAGGGRTQIVMAASNGFSGAYARTNYWISASVIVGQDTNMETDYDYETKVFQSDLPSAASIGHKASQRALRNLNARKMPTCQVPVIFDPRESHGLLGSFVGAISGSGVARGTSFLKDFMGKKVFADAINIIDDPFVNRGHRSKMFDGEGIAPEKRTIVQDGVLQTWLLDLRSARQLGLKSTGHASRGTSSMPHPSPTNFYLQAGAMTPAELIKDIKSGFYVTQLMGDGINDVTGDLSQGARGFWIENGVITHAVSEMTVAGNLKDMFLNATAANDLEFRYGIDAPTLRIEGMTVAGS